MGKFRNLALKTMILGSLVSPLKDTPYRESGFEYVLVNEITNPERRQKTQEEFLEMYETTNANWDNFGEQMTLVRTITLSDKLKERGKMNPYYRRVLLRNVKTGETLIHELGHFWYHNLSESERQRLDSLWTDITGDFYPDSTPKQISRHLIPRGSVFPFTLKSVGEDIAITLSFIYLSANPLYRVNNLPHEVPEFRDQIKNIATFPLIPNLRSQEDYTIFTSKLTRKIVLLEEFGFISSRERDYVVSEIQGLRVSQ